MRVMQIGIIGSMADTKISKASQGLAWKIGREIARKGATLLFSFEKDFDSLPTIAAQACKNSGGQTVAFVSGERLDHQELDSVTINTGQLRGGGREFSLVLSCDAVICLGGGSGTLMEIAMAYQAGIPIIAIKNSGGWSSKLAGKFLDKRKRIKIAESNSAKEAVKTAIESVKIDF